MSAAADIRDWWRSLVRCPSCGFDPGDGVACPHCRRGFTLTGLARNWLPSGPPDAPPRASLGRRIRTLCNPLRTPLLPLRYVGAWRVEEYYRRTLTDGALARRWADHYLRGLAIPAGATVLDFGCGRGRNVGILRQLGYRVVGQDRAPHPWWADLPGAGFQVAADARLPWSDDAFDLVVEVGVIHYMPPADAAQHAREIARVLKPGGVWLLVEANAAGAGAEYVRRQLPRLHRREEVAAWIADAGLREVDGWFEGYYAPRLAGLVSFMRHVMAPGELDLVDYDSWFARRLAPERRAHWVVRSVKARSE